MFKDFNSILCYQKIFNPNRNFYYIHYVVSKKHEAIMAESDVAKL